MVRPDIERGNERWQGRLRLGFTARDGRTLLAERRHQGPLAVQRPFYPEGPAVCHAYVLHPPGGVVGGDGLRLEIAVATGARALVTTPGATKLYRSAGPEAAIDQAFAVAAGASLEWLPQETIAHDGVRADQETVVDLDGDAAFAGWEICCLGLAASDETFAAGAFSQGFRLTRDGQPLFADRCRFHGGSPMLDAAWGLGGERVCGLFVATLPAGGAGLFPDDPERAALSDGPAAFGLLDGLLVGRYVGGDAREARRLFGAAWSLWRKRVAGLPPCPPRIWNT